VDKNKYQDRMQEIKKMNQAIKDAGYELEMEKLKEELRGLALQQEIKIFGVANFTPVRDFIHETYGDELIHLHHGVMLGVPYPISVINQLEAAPTHTYLHYYNVLNAKLDQAALSLALCLQEHGYEAFPIPGSQRVTDDKLAGIFSHRLGGNLAGLGWVGKSSNFIHPVYGPRLRLVTVLTDAPLPAGQPMENKCGSCTKCMESCPPHAITGKPFDAKDPLEERFIGSLCDQYLSKVRVAFGKRVCGKCLAACPWGKDPHLKTIEAIKVVD
jgi:epoxyqueuosine reductase